MQRAQFSIYRVVFTIFFTILRLRNKSLQFHVHCVSRMRKYIPFDLLRIRAQESYTCTLQRAGLRVVGGKLALHGLYSCSLYYSWQLSVLLACSRSPIMQCIHLLVIVFSFFSLSPQNKRKTLHTSCSVCVCVYSVNNDLTGVEEVGVVLPEPRLLLL